MEIEKYVFVKPELKNIYNKIVDSNKLQAFLKRIGAIITVDDYYEAYDLSKKTDKYTIKALESVKEINKNTILNLATLLLENNDTIVKLSVNELVNSKFLFDKIADIFGFSTEDEIDYSTFKEFYYIYKFSYIDNFFQNNWEKFIPEVDTEEINNNKIAKSFVEALMIEFDKINNIINNVKDFSDYKKIPYEYINYLTQLLGFEQLHLSLTEEYEEELRIIAANIIDVYRLRGTISSFELLFNFLGFNVEIVQYYFDRRYKFNSSGENTETQEGNVNNYRYYLTKNNPANNISDYFPIIETVSDNDFVKPLSFERFTELVSRYGLDCVLGYSDIYTYNGEYEVDKKGEKKLVKNNAVDESGKRIYAGNEYIYTGPVYSYFLTNIVDIKPTLISDDKNFTIKQLNILSKLLKFLVPEFWKKHYVVAVSFGKKGDLPEKIVVNGKRDLDTEGFRMLDDEDWIYNEGNEYFFNETGEYILTSKDSDGEVNKEYELNQKRYEQALLEEKRYRVLQLYGPDESGQLTAKNKYIKINEDTILKEVDINSVSTFDNIVRTVAAEDNGDGKSDYKYYEVLTSDGRKESLENSNLLYRNSADEDYKVNGFFENFTKKLGDNKLKIVNTTKGLGAMMKLRDDKETKNARAYKFWKRDSHDGKGGNYWYPPKDKSSRYSEPEKNYLARNDLYYPADADLDVNNSYLKVERTNFNSLKGQSLRKAFLAINNDTRINLTRITKQDENESFAGCIKRITDTKTEISKLTNGVWEAVSFSNNRILAVAKNLKDLNKINKNKYIAVSTLSNFVKKHNTINYDYINNQLLIGEKKDTETKYFDISKCKFYIKGYYDNKFDTDKKIPVYGICYENIENNALTKLLKDNFDIGCYYLQRTVENVRIGVDSNNVPTYENVEFYVVYRLNDPKEKLYNYQKLVAYRYKISDVKYKSNSFFFNTKLVNENDERNIRVGEYFDIVRRIKNVSDADVKLLNPYLKIKKDNNKVNILSKQPTEYRVFSYGINSNYDYKGNLSPCLKMEGGYIEDGKTDNLNNIGKLEINQFAAFNDSDYIASEYSKNNEGKFIETVGSETCKATYGDFYFNFSSVEDERTTNFTSNYKEIPDIISKREKKIITKRHACMDGNLYYYDGDILKFSLNTVNVLNAYNNDSFICEKITDKVVTEKKYLSLEDTNDVVDKKITPGLENENYVLDINGNLVPNQKTKIVQSLFVDKDVLRDNGVKEFISGIKKVDLKGKVVEENQELNLYAYDNKYSGVSEDEDNDNYILNNNERLIKWNIVKNIYKTDQQQDGNFEFDNKKITRPIRKLIDEKFDSYITKTEAEGKEKFLKNILEEMLGTNASLNIASSRFKWE